MEFTFPITTKLCMQCVKERVCAHPNCPCKQGAKHYCRKCNTHNSLHRSANCEGKLSSIICTDCGGHGHCTCNVINVVCDRHSQSAQVAKVVNKQQKPVSTSSYGLTSRSTSSTSSGIPKTPNKNTISRSDLDMKPSSGEKWVVCVIPFVRNDHGIFISFHVDNVKRFGTGNNNKLYTPVHLISVDEVKARPEEFYQILFKMILKLFK